ncbi:sortase [Candidatus Microgenomates bacterium]|nr:sortase [Candidatus Microgenomates bacterium]
MSINLITPNFLKKLKKIQKQQQRLLTLSKTFAILGAIFVVLSFAPSVWYSMGASVDDFSKAILQTVKGKEGVVEEPIVKLPDWQPGIDPKLPRATTLVIPSIKIATQVNEATFQNYEEALKKGVWRVPDFGTPADRTKPTIMAAHRFGYLAWSNTFRRLNSFYNLPKLNTGDTVEIYYKQRKYVYEVYGESRGEEIEDYSANLILYTCETLNSKVRIFRYARLLKI